MNFVFVSLQRINTDRESTSTSLAKELSKEHRVLYVNPPIDRRTWYSKTNDIFTQSHIQDIKNKKVGLVKVTEHLSVLSPEKVIESINWIPFTAVFSLFNRINNKRFSSCIKEAIQELGFESFILVNDKDMFRSFYLKELLRPALYVYLDRDYTIGFGYWKRHGPTLEPLLMKKSDAVVCNSLDFTKRALTYNPNSFYIGNGADLEVFDHTRSWEKPEELKTFKRPVVGYVGALNSMRININLIGTIARKRADWDFVFIGEEDENFIKSDLHTISNITFFKKKHTNLIPAYVRYFDVCINPQLVNEITIGNFPLKIIEYLAMGRPVVATATNTMKEVFSAYTYLAITADEYIEAIENAMKLDSPNLQQERIKFAHTYSWPSVVKIFLKYINQVAKDKNIPV
ncbi:glycosyltransferase [Arcticibacter eurypsychrophilus]|uniref:glycosyltransferase n=1 Tax=Arcticibacter eurypsychrophilus TaxID=1434752 RepID=UPI00084DAAC3|nr:glycosyltransferase [Arcticibacter eurypsychrophilus]